MFTGIIEQVGTIARVTKNATGAAFRIDCGLGPFTAGESIATNGTCLTVTTFDDAGYHCEASHETLSKTTLGTWSVGTKVHLERALRADTHLGGHLVSGHVDGLATLVTRNEIGDACFLEFEVPANLSRFLAPKGSVTLDGASLTVNGAKGLRFDVMLVPYTRTETHFDALKIGANINIEVDILAKYVARLLGRPGVDGISPGGSEKDDIGMDLLERQGYLTK